MNVVTDKVEENVKSENNSQFWGRPYQYDRLPLLAFGGTIRVLDLAPGNYDDPLEGQLRVASISASLGSEHESVNYEALSYCWGSEPADDTTLLRLGGGQFLSLRPNLDAALRQLRYEGAPRTLWIDAICINQSDEEEKSFQVRQMLEVYAKADTVIIWLGPARGNSSLGMEVLRYLAEKPLSNLSHWGHPDLGLLEGIREVLLRDWFSRIWVVQEAAVSRRAVMMCGHDSFGWVNDPVQVQKFIRRIKYLAISPQWEQAGLSEINIGPFLQVLNLQMQHIEKVQRRMFTSPRDILDVAFETRHRNAGDRRDKLFAVMGLVDSRQEEMRFQADYSMNVEEVFEHLLETIEV